MKRPLLLALGFFLAFGLTTPFVAAQESQATPEIEITTEKPKPTVAFARSWEAGVEEAKLLNLPLIIHSHGFY